MYTCIYVYMCVYIYIYIYIYIYVVRGGLSTHDCACLYTDASVCYTTLRISSSIYMHACMHACMDT